MSEDLMGKAKVLREAFFELRNEEKWQDVIKFGDMGFMLAVLLDSGIVDARDVTLEKHFFPAGIEQAEQAFNATKAVEPERVPDTFDEYYKRVSEELMPVDIRSLYDYDFKTTTAAEFYINQLYYILVASLGLEDYEGEFSSFEDMVEANMKKNGIQIDE